MMSLSVAGVVSAAPESQPESRESTGPRVVLPDIDMPSKGMTMKAVKKRYGEPNEVAPSIGEPPITRWVYDRFTVYFEDKWVLHSVVPRSLKLKTMRSRTPPTTLDNIYEEEDGASSPFD